MNELSIFQYTDKKIRTVIIDGEPWFVAKDICEILDIEKYRDAVTRLSENQRGSVVADTPGGKQEMAAINESGVYKLAFTSRKPEAEKFTDWLAIEVIPSIRKHGGYLTPAKIEEVLLNPDTIIQLATTLKEAQEKNKALLVENTRLSVDNQIMAPKADYFDELVDRNLLTNFRETAKQLEIKEKDFISFLLNKKYIYRDKRGKLMPYADKNNGLFEIKETFNEKTKWSGTQTMITPKGRETFRLLYLKSAS